MTLNLFVLRTTSADALIAQLGADLGVSSRLVAERPTFMEVFPTKVMTIHVDAEESRKTDALRWFQQRGIHSQLTVAA